VPQASSQNLQAAEVRYQSLDDGESAIVKQEMDYNDLLDESRFER